MGLETQNVPIDFRRGVDTKTDAKQVVPGKLLALTNGTFQVTGSITKRNGYTALAKTIIAAGGNIATGLGLAAYKSELTLADGAKLYSYSPDETAWSPATGALIPTSVTTQPIFQSSAAQASADSAYHAGTGLQCFVSTSTFGISVTSPVVYSIVDSTTGVKLVSGAVVPSSTSSTIPKVIAFQNYFIIIFAVNGTNNLYYCAVSTATPTVIGAAVLITADILDTIPSRQNFDATVINARLFVAWNTTHGGGSVRLTYYDSSLVQGIAPAVTGENANGCITIFGDAANNAWVAYYDSGHTQVRGFIYDYSLVTLVLGATAITGTNPVTNITGVIMPGSSPVKAQFYMENTGTYLSQIHVGTMTIGGTTTAANFLHNVGLAGKAFAYGADTYVLATYQGTAVQSAPQQAYFLVNSAGRVIAKLMEEEGSGYTPRHLSEANAMAAGTYQYGLLQVSQTGLISGLTVNVYGVSSSTITFGAAVSSVELANSLHLSGGFLSLYDGAQVAEHGFHLYPEIASTTSGATGLTGTYSYVATYEWVDNQGQTHRSSPSLPVTIAVSNKSITLAITTLSLTAKTSTTSATGAVSIGIYRTLAAGTIYYRVTNVGSPEQNDTSAEAVTYTDATSDTDLQGQGTLYTTDGEVENMPVPAPLFMTSYKQRMVVVPAESPTSWWFSKQIVPGSPVEFSDSFVQNEDQRGGAFTAGAQLDDKLILFKRNILGYVVGDGPAPNGSANDFTPWQVIQTDTGCSAAASVVAMPDGLMYQTPKGIYLLDRSLKDHYIGADVEAYNAYTVTSALRVQGTTQVRFTLSNGTALVYDYADTVKDDHGIGQWSVFTNISAVAATLYQGGYTYVTSAGLVLEETASLYTDNGSGIQLSLTTSWFSFAQLQGFQRVYQATLLGAYQSAHTLQVQVAYNFDPTVRQSGSVAASSAPPYQYEINFARQKCEAIQLTVQDTSPTGQSMSLSALTFVVGVKKGTFRMAPTRSV